MQIFALFMLLGLFTTFLIPETARKTLEELSGDDRAGFTEAAQGADVASGEGDAQKVEMESKV
jgi:PHS family inorganic phosphate transporter-like MFS transporter